MISFKIVTVAAAASLLSLVACKSESTGAGPASSKASSPSGSAATAASTAKGPSAAAAPAAAAGDETKVVDLAPLPLTFKMPKSETAVKMDMSVDATLKSVNVSYDALFAGINVSVPSEKNFNEVKASAKADTMLQPFKRWVSESATNAVEEFKGLGDKPAFIAYTWKTVGGKNYVCRSTGPGGLRSADDAQKIFAVCDTLAGK